MMHAPLADATLGASGRRRRAMTAKSAFSDDEWKLIAEGPVTAGMLLVTADSGGMFRETYALARSYAEARKEHGESELLDEIVSSKPEFDRHRYRSPEQIRTDG